MNINDYFNIVAKANKTFTFWIKEQSIEFKCLQFVFPFVESDIEITTYIFYQKNSNISQYNVDGTTRLLIKKFKELLELNHLPKDVINVMSFEIDSHENVTKNFDGNYFYRLR